MLLAFHDNTAKRSLCGSEGLISSVATADDKVILAGWRQIVETTVDDLGIALQDLGHRNRLVLMTLRIEFIVHAAEGAADRKPGLEELGLESIPSQRLLGDDFMQKSEKKLSRDTGRGRLG